MKILHINCTNYGSTGKIIDEIMQSGSLNDESLLCFAYGNPRKNEIKISNNFIGRIAKNVSKLTGLQYSHSKLSTLRIIKVIKNWKPDIVHLHSVNVFTADIYTLVKWLKARNINIVLTNHAEFFYTGSCAHAYDCKKWMTGCKNCTTWKPPSGSLIKDRTHTAWLLMKKAFSDYPNIYSVSVSPWQAERISQSLIMKDIPQYTIFNGIDLKTFYIKENIKAIREKLGFKKEDKIILHVTSEFSNNPKHIKGGFYFLKIAEKLYAIDPNFKFLVLGPKISDFEIPDYINYLGELHDQNVLADYYRCADVVVSCSKRETFGMICPEALCCGTPVVGFFCGGMESVALDEVCNFCEYGDVDELCALVFKMLSNEDIKWPVDKVYKIYSNENMTKKYWELYRKIIDSNIEE